jgi:Protein of unknown function (DUF5672)
LRPRQRRTPLLKLPSVAIVAIDTVAPDLLRLAIKDSLAQVEPAAVLVWSDVDPGISGVEHIPTQKLTSLTEVASVLWYSVPERVETSHFLTIQWDGWVLNAGCWDNRFLDFDYIGAVWPWFYRDRVGNGGFSLRSTRLARRIASQPTKFPLEEPEDAVLCRKYKYALARDGEFLWAPESLAAQFSFEAKAPRPSGTFGFHDCQNFPTVLEPGEVHDRLAVATEYVREKVQFGKLMEKFYGKA